MKYLTMLLLLGLCGCVTIPKMKKNEIFTNVEKKSFIKHRHFEDILKYWDDNSTKVKIDFANATYVQRWSNPKHAEISIGNGPYYGLIQLHHVNDSQTKVDYYSWGHFKNRISDWINIINEMPEAH